MPTYSVQYDSQTRLGASLSFVRGEVSDTLSVGGPHAQLAVAHDGARVGIGYGWGLMFTPDPVPPVLGFAARLAFSHGWGLRGTRELGGLRVGPELELVLFGLKLQAGLGHHLSGRRGEARALSWSLGVGF